ncbi:MAG: cytidine deaminase [Candidatus Aenigmarchaeota archaeon]|nr:cytidine deaminase [Candidatus Aenigmarchaeota archaeon]
MMSDKELIEKAQSAVRPRKSAAGKLLADVGAALVTSKGNIYVGVSFDTQEGSGLCAERAAIASMITAGEYEIKKIVAVWTNGTIIPPCGACREWMWQTDKRNWETEVMVGKNKIAKLKDLLPYHWHNPEFKK